MQAGGRWEEEEEGWTADATMPQKGKVKVQNALNCDIWQQAARDTCTLMRHPAAVHRLCCLMEKHQPADLQVRRREPDGFIQQPLHLSTPEHTWAQV